ncbi:MAG: hypothetical protein WCG98_03225 [bacterium]
MFIIPVPANVAPVVVAHPIYADHVIFVVHWLGNTTVAITDPVFPAKSLKVNIYVPLLVNSLESALYHVSGSLIPVSVAITYDQVLLYMMLAVGGILSIRLTVAIALPVCHPMSEKVNVNDQFSVNVYQRVLISKRFLFHPVSVAITSPLVRLPDADE